MSLVFNDHAEKFLTENGFDCEPDPEWIEGKVPDFFCTGKARMWVEVKSLDQPKEYGTRGRIFNFFKEQESRVSLPGWAMAFVSDDASQRDVRIALSITNAALKDLNKSGEEYSRAFVIIPNEPIYGEYVKIIAQGDQGREIFHCCKSLSGKYGRPYSGGEINWDASAKVIDSNGVISECRPEDLGLFNDNFVLALSLFSSDDKFSIRSLSGTGLAREIPNVKKVRRVADRANQQFKNACLEKDVPCFLMIYHEDILTSEDEMFISAFYGDLQAVFNTGSAQTDVSLQYGPNGIWSPDKHRTTSAACYIRNMGIPTIVHNIWARHKLSPSLFTSVEYIPKQDGTFDKVENLS